MVSGCMNDRTVEITEITAIASYNSFQNDKKLQRGDVMCTGSKYCFWNIAITDSKNEQYN